MNSRGLQMTLTEPTSTTPGTAVITQVYRHAPEIAASFAGGVQTRSGGSRFLGYGGVPQATLLDAAGNSQLEVNLSAFSYRAFLKPWVGQPTEPPAAAVRTENNATVVLPAGTAPPRSASGRSSPGPMRRTSSSSAVCRLRPASRPSWPSRRTPGRWCAGAGA